MWLPHSLSRLSRRPLYRVEATAGLFGLVLGACAPAQSDLAVDETNRVLTPEQRFQLGYLGNWSEDANCVDNVNMWEITSTTLRVGDTVCRVDTVPGNDAKIRVRLSNCDGESDDSNLDLDLAGEDVLYVEPENGDRLRLERCEGEAVPMSVDSLFD